MVGAAALDTVLTLVALPPQVPFIILDRVFQLLGPAAVQRGPLVCCTEETDNGSLLGSFTVDTGLPLAVKEDTLLKGKRLPPDMAVWPEDILYSAAPQPQCAAELKLIKSRRKHHVSGGFQCGCRI